MKQLILLTLCAAIISAGEAGVVTSGVLSRIARVPSNSGFNMDYGSITNGVVLKLSVFGDDPNCWVTSGRIINPTDAGWTQGAGGPALFTCIFAGPALGWVGLHEGSFAGEYACAGGGGSGGVAARPTWDGKAISQVCVKIWTECALENRKANPDFNPATERNGCGSSAINVPDSFSFEGITVNFTPECNRHDDAYGTCNYGKSMADLELMLAMMRKCRTALQPLWSNPNVDVNLAIEQCSDIARVYYTALDMVPAWVAYNGGQKSACLCCK